MPLFTCGSVHQGDVRFSNDSRGKQCSFISLIALFVEQTIPMCEWNCQIVDNILSLGDRMYVHALKNQLILSTELFSVTNLPSVLGCRIDFRCILTALTTSKFSNTTIQTIHSNCDHTIYGIGIDAGCLRTKNTPHDYIKNNDLPKEVEPIVAKNSMTAILQNTNLPIEVEPIVAQKDSQIWHVKYGQYLQGLIPNNDGLEAIDTPYVTLRSALMDTFSQYKYAILILQGYMIGIIFGIDPVFYVFHSHGRDEHGMPNPNGIAVVMSYENIDDLEYHLHSFSGVLNRNAFEITPVEFVQLNHACHDCSMSESNLHFKNLIAETEAQQQIKRAKAKEYLNKSRSKETVEQKQARLAKAKHIVRRKRSLENDLERQTRLENAKHSI